MRPAPASIVLVAVVLGVVGAGCARCSGETKGADLDGGAAAGSASASAAVPAPTVPKVPPPETWGFATVRGPPGIAVPDHCRSRGALMVARVPVTTHFAADARTLGALMVADTTMEPAAVLRSGVLTIDAGGKSVASEGAPWPDARGVPRVAVSGERWLAAWEVARERGASEVMLFRGGELRSLGVGDAFVAADLMCGTARCALLTSRAARVAPVGAEVVMLPADARDASAAPRTITIEPDPAGGGARPFGMAAVDGAQGAVAVLTEGGEAVFWKVDGESGPTVMARLPAARGVLDATLVGERPVVMAHGNVVDEQGCAREGADAAGAKVHFVRAGESVAEVRSPGAPALAALRPLAHGALAVWLSPLGCGAERRVVYAVVLDEAGAPRAAPMPVGDGDTFALAARGSDADLWVRRGGEVVWVQLTCGDP